MLMECGIDNFEQLFKRPVSTKFPNIQQLQAAFITYDYQNDFSLGDLKLTFTSHF